MAYTVAQRTQEFGIRMAIGAGSSDVLWLVLGQGMKLGLIGVALGAAGAFALTRLLRQLLFGVDSFDLATFLVTALLLTIVIMVACYIPARRATSLIPSLPCGTNRSRWTSILLGRSPCAESIGFVP